MDQQLSECAINFLHRFIQKEHKTLIALYSERNYEIVQSHINALQQYYLPRIHPFISVRIYRDPVVTEKWFEEKKAILEQVLPRILFQVKHYNHSELGDLYRCYVSSDKQLKNGESQYFSNLYVATVDAEFKIISEYLVCLDCEGSGFQNGLLCPDCNFNGWIYSTGIKLNTPGTLLEVVKFEAPENPQHREEYNLE